MGWLNTLLNRVAGVAPTEWTLLPVPDPGLGIAGKPIAPDQCYIELYVESLRLKKARRFGTTFHGVVYSFASLAHTGSNRAELAAVTKPQNLAALDANNLDRVITVSKRIMGAMPWRGDPLELELGLFSVKAGNLLTPLVDYVAKISEKVGIGVVTNLNPFLPLITEGLDMIAGQTADTVIELAIDTDMSLAESILYALIALPKGEVNPAEITIDKTDRKLLQRGTPFDAGYCVFSTRYSDQNPDWGSIPALQQAYDDVKGAIGSGKHANAQEALAGFNRQVIMTPDLISTDKDRLRSKALDDFKAAFPGGGQSAPASARERFKGRVLTDLDLYGDRPTSTR